MAQSPNENAIMRLAINTSETFSDTSLSKTVSSFRLAIFLGILLVASGCVHLALFAIQGTTWKGPLSLRKPALFGISGGLTIWSIAWLMTQLLPKKSDRFLASSLAIGLFIEVTLITVQTWRGVASHFNRATSIDAAIEFAMLGLILIVSCGIVYLSFRTFRLRNIDPAMVIAIRGGMWLLTLSCGLGILTSILGEISISAGRSYELWGGAGVLKFPHGVALHAIQMLPAIAWMARSLGVSGAVRIMQSALASQVLFLVYAIWQTIQGRDRFDWDTVGGSILGVAILFGLFPAVSILQGLIQYSGRKPN